MNMLECSESSLVEFLELSNLILFGGNESIQKSFLKCFESDHENRLILKLSAQIKKASERFMRKEKIRNTANQMLFMSRKLKNDHLKYNPALDTDTVFLRNMLNFIKLLCENHNSSFQQFLKEQTRDKVLNSISVNFPIEICNIINSYLEVCNYYSYWVGHELFCALEEIV